MLQDLKYAARRLGQNRAFSATVIFTLALGIGATTAIFSVVYGVLLRPLPYPRPDRLVTVHEVNHRGTYSRLADPNFDDFRDQNRTFQAMGKYASFVANVSGHGEPTRGIVSQVSRDFFAVLGVHPTLGRTLMRDDAHPGAAPVALVSARYWKQHLSARQDLLALTLRVQDRVCSVVGILPEWFDFPAKTDLWLPAELEPANPSRTSHNWGGIGRLRNGVSLAQATGDLEVIAARIIQQAPEKNDYLLKSAAAVRLLDSQTSQMRTPLYVLLGAVGILLLIACANAANLLLAQASTRGHELALRHALGAGRGQLVRQFIAETLLLSALSGVAGVLIATALLRALLAFAPPDLPRLSDVTIGWPVLAFTSAVSLLAAVGLGIATALRSASATPRDALVRGGRGGAGTARTQGLGRLIVAAQLAMTLALLTGAGLLGRSLLQVLSVDPGFRMDDLVAVDFQLPAPGELTPEAEAALRARRSQLVARLVQRVAAVRGVQRVAAVSAVPMAGGHPDGMFLLVTPQDNPKTFEEYSQLARQPERVGSADFCAATPAYLQALGIPLVRGRWFEERDGFDAPHVAVISESLARIRWPGRDPIGQMIQFGNMDGDMHPLTVVGVVADTHEYGPEQPPRPTFYVNLLQRPRSQFSVVMQTPGDGTRALAAARAIVHEEIPDVAPRFRTFTEIYAASLGSRRFNLTVIAVFALSALLLALAGVYGVVAHGVAQRTREIGVRMALGARPIDVLSPILRQGLWTMLLGVAIGVAGSLAVARAIQSLLFGVRPSDPLTFIGVATLLVAVAGIACYIPARRATKVDPTVALRYD